ncbi:MAG TPA: beta-propeller domain-containing protein, partial [Microlunatus sp.]|nr:beta-propeller domain-containing protein [Microlunatus sp.]
MKDPIGDAEMNDPGMSDGGQNSFEARARKASESVRQQLAAAKPGDELGLRRAHRPIHRMAIPRVAAAAVLVAGIALLGPRLVGGGGSGSAGLGGAGVAYAAGPLKAFANCDAVLGYFKDHAPDYLIEQASRGWAADGRAELPSPPTAARAADATAGAALSTPAHSTTNVAEAGVDEPDLVKTDGKVIVAVARGRVHLISAHNGQLSKVATLPDTDVGNVFLSGTRVLVFSGQRPDEVAPGPRSARQRQLLTIYDIATLRTPKLVATLAVDGDVLDARLVGAQVRVVTAFSPDLDIPSPYFGREGGIAEESKKQLQDAVAKSTVDDWLPTYTLTNGVGAQVSSGRLVDCADLARPEKFSGIDTVAVSSFDITSTLQDRHTVGVVAGGQQLYATDTATYVTTTEWSRDDTTPTTSVHKFLTGPSGATSYRGSGEVPGSLLNQYAMSEVDGVLRVATTVSGSRGWVNSRMVNEGVVTMLREQDGTLKQIGQIDGLGRKDNESIRAVRFIGNVGYVVTFRQTDPLYVLDLRDPAAPKITGELKIPGYSGYLHPIGTDLLLGVGQSGKGKIQFSLFNVSDPGSPRRIDTQAYGWGNAAAEFDPKAFLSWEPRNLVMAPITSYGPDKL